MEPNPYHAPASLALDPPERLNRAPFVLAALGAGLASLYWAAITALIAFGTASGATSGMQLVLPCVLVGLYAMRGFQLFKGDPAAAQRVLWLHGVGGVVAIIQIATGDPFIQVLHGIKVAIHVFGAVTAYRAKRA